MILIVIPARLESTRLPRKPLALIGNYPLIWWSWEKAKKSLLADQVVVATDSEQISEAMEAYGVSSVLTSSSCQSGSDRVWEAAQMFPEADIIINLQGDEPLMPVDIIDGVINLLLERPEVEMASACVEFLHPQDLNSPNCVKTIFTSDHKALYFSRSAMAGSSLHLGIYGFRRSALEKFCALAPSRLEKEERLEQLRALENGMSIYLHTAQTSQEIFGVDTEADLLKATKILLA